MTDDIQLGDVVIDLAQGRPMQVIEAYDERAAAFSEGKSFDLLEVYGNERLGVTADDRVYECVYCSSIKSEPSRSYAFPESRIARVDVNAADGGPRLSDRIARQVLADLFAAANESDVDTLGGIATKAFDETLARDALELAETRPEGED